MNSDPKPAALAAVAALDKAAEAYSLAFRLCLDAVGDGVTDAFTVLQHGVEIANGMRLLRADMARISREGT